jgi:hypothetical protein
MTSRSFQLRTRAAAACIFALALWHATAALAQQADTGSDVTVQVSAGLGMGTRALQRATEAGLQHIDAGLFPAADIGMRVDIKAAARVSLSVFTRYQTTLYDVVQEHPPLAPPSEVHVRSHHVELGVEPTWHSASANDWAIGLNVGYCFRVFWTDVHNLATPRQLLTGPYLRPEFELPFLGRFLLRVGPELVWILTMDQELRRSGEATPGIALGLQAQLSVQLTSAYGLELLYRGSHAVAFRDLTDIERFLTLSFTGRF